MQRLPVGKLPQGMLAELLARHVAPDERVISGPGIGRDAAIIDMGDRFLVAKTDPVTFATDEIGWYAVQVNANDVACTGARPRWFLATLLLPEHHTTRELVEDIFSQIAEACRALDIALCGGHTEITLGLKRPIVVGQMLGEVSPADHLRGDGTRVGDAIILTKSVALEATAILAREKRAELARECPAIDLAQCAGLLRDPGISVVADAALALETGGVHALHDPTEGGVATGLYELAIAAGIGLRVDRGALPVLPECAALCHHFGLDVWGLIASGSLLIAAAPDRAAAVSENLIAHGVPATRIAQAVPAHEGMHLVDEDGSLHPLPVFTQDEIAKALALR